MFHVILPIQYQYKLDNILIKIIQKYVPVENSAKNPKMGEWWEPPCWENLTFKELLEEIIGNGFVVSCLQ